MYTNYEIAIVGGGVIGLSVALGLAEKGVAVAIIDPALSNDGGASQAAGAMIDAFGENELADSPIATSLLKMRLDSQRLYRGWLDNIEAISDRKIHNNEGIFIVANAGGDHDIEHFNQIRTLMTQHEEPFQDAEPKNVPGLVPNTAFQAHSAIYMPEAMSVDTGSLLLGLQSALSRFKNVKNVREKVDTIDKVGECWEITLSNQTVINADKVLLSAGAHTTTLLSEELRIEAGIPKVYYGRGISCITSGGPELPHTIRTPNRALACGIHLVPRSSGELYLGASNLFGMDLSLPKGPSVGELHSMLGTVCNQLNTNLRNVSVSKFLWGLRPVTADGAPLMGESKIPGLYVATAMHRVGVTLAPLVKNILCNEILGLSNDNINPFPIRHKMVTSPQHNVVLGIRSLLATVLYPDGYMPYNRSQELEVFITELFKMATNQGEFSDLRERILQLSNEIEMDEQAMIRIFHEVLNAKIPEKGPFAL